MINSSALARSPVKIRGVFPTNFLSLLPPGMIGAGGMGIGRPLPGGPPPGGPPPGGPPPGGIPPGHPLNGPHGGPWGLPL